MIQFHFLDHSDQRMAAWLASHYERIKAEVERGAMRGLAAVSRQLTDERLGHPGLGDRSGVLRSGLRQHSSPISKRPAGRKRSGCTASRRSSFPTAGFRSPGQTRRVRRNARWIAESLSLLRSRVLEQRLIVLAELSRGVAEALRS